MIPFIISQFPKVLYEDVHLIVIDKPAGLLSQGEKTGDANVVDWARERFKRNYVGLVHRLDRNTSGLMVVAKRTKSAERLTTALQGGKIYRSYLAWLYGSLDKPARWSHRLHKDQQTNRVQIVSRTHPQGKDAALAVEPVQRAQYQGKPVTLVKFELETGRSHQIRVQSTQENYPLVGDIKYSTPESLRDTRSFGRPALHSWSLAFEHPMSGDTLRFECELPADMAALLPDESPSD